MFKGVVRMYTIRIATYEVFLLIKLSLWRSGSKAPFILNLSVRKKCEVSYSLWSLYPRDISPGVL